MITGPEFNFQAICRQFGGVDPDGTLLDFHVDEVKARQSIAANSRTSVLVADITKFGRNATVRGGHIDDSHHLVIDDRLPATFELIAQRYSGQIHTAGDARADFERIDT